MTGWPRRKFTANFGFEKMRHDIHIAGKRDRDNNNKMERLNGEIRDREKVFRGLKRFDTPIIDGMKAYYSADHKFVQSGAAFLWANLSMSSLNLTVR